ncbi:MAG TPA: kynureninase [Lacunisphaera sp.]|nr:kynureninase [Lacunisphaera sp.]
MRSINPEPGRRAAALDEADPLARFRAEFYLPAGQIYLDGNSLGLLSRHAETHLQRVLGEWRTLGITGWTDANPPWITLSETIAAQLAPLLGAAPDEVALTGSTTTNLHQLLATLFDPSAARKVIVADELNFPSDLHALASHLRQRGLDPATYLRLVPSRDGHTLRAEDILAALTPDVQLLLLPVVQYTSGQLLDVAAITREARARGILTGFDCSHSIGAVPHALDNAGVDFAFWCNYKYLNAGPGAVGGLYLNRRHFGRASGLAGWWGVRKDRRFAMAAQHEPAPDASALHIGTPHLLSLAPLQGSLEIFAEAGGLAPLRAKSLAQTAFMLELADAELPDFAIASPRADHERGGHIALVHPEAWRICSALKAAGVVPDFRPPDIIRLAPAPLYTSFADCAAAIARLKEVMRTKAYEKFPDQRALVT